MIYRDVLSNKIYLNIVLGDLGEVVSDIEIELAFHVVR